MVTEGIADSQFLEENKADGCGVAPIWCGLRGLNYPSKLPLGYPFDRRPFSVEDLSGSQRVVANLEEYVGALSNTNTVQVSEKPILGIILYHLQNSKSNFLRVCCDR